MTRPKAASNAVTEAAGVLEFARNTLAVLEADQAAATAELESLQARAGAEVLDDPGAATRLPRKMQELRDRIDITQRAAEAQRPRVAAAESAYLTAEADQLEGPVVAARAALAKHEARTAELLALLEEHEGRFVPERVLLEERRVTGASFVRLRDKSEQLRDEVDAVELPVAILRAMAAGENPQRLLSAPGRTQRIDPAAVYPSCVWGPDALVPAPAYIAAMARQRQEHDSREAGREAARRRVEELEEAIARGEVADPTPREFSLATAPPLPEQLQVARGRLAELEALASS